MALIIKGDMPVGKGCDECEFQTSRCEQLDACTCFLFNGCIHNFHNERHKDCPIIGEIPDSHGRLVNADAIISKIERMVHPDDLTYTIAYGILKQFIEDAETIVEATE